MRDRGGEEDDKVKVRTCSLFSFPPRLRAMSLHRRTHGALWHHSISMTGKIPEEGENKEGEEETLLEILANFLLPN